MEEVLKLERILKILGESECLRDFRCAKYGFQELCRAQDIGLESHLVCLEEDLNCSFAITQGVGEKWWCQCPVRIFIAKEYGK